jgi:hypothetical protein
MTVMSAVTVNPTIAHTGTRRGGFGGSMGTM